MAEDFRKGDRSRRDDDRYLFLESLLSARHCFYVSYTGQHIRDNSVLPPSVLVSELLDYVVQGFRPAAGADIREQLVTHHPLQAFSRRYFDGSGKWFSYSGTLCRAAALAGRGSAAPQPLIAADLSEPEAEWRTLELESLVRFLRNPTRYLLQRRLEIRLEEAEEEVEAREPFTPDALQAYELKQRLLAFRLHAKPLPEVLAVTRASGLLPHARVGEVLFERTSRAVDEFAEKILAALPKRVLDSIGVDLAIGEVRIRGALVGVSEAGLLGYRLGRGRAKDLLNAWVRHLVLNIVAPEGVARMTRWIWQDKAVTFVPVNEAHAILEQLTALYWRGLRRPLHFFPESAHAYIEKNHSLDAAHGAWDISDFARGEAADPYYRLAFRGSDPLDAEFEEIATAVFDPMKAAMREEPAA
jgi:exodeoxyribonuclease V gamma subunit